MTVPEAGRFGQDALVLSSYRPDNWARLRHASACIESAGFSVYPPSNAEPRILPDGYVVMGTDHEDENEHRSNVQSDFMLNGISQAKFVYVIPALKGGGKERKGYVGRTVAHEIGAAILANRPVILASPLYEMADETPSQLATIIRKKMSKFHILSPETITKHEILSIIAENPRYELTDNEERYLKGNRTRLLTRFRQQRYASRPS